MTNLQRMLPFALIWLATAPCWSATESQSYRFEPSQDSTVYHRSAGLGGDAHFGIQGDFELAIDRDTRTARIMSNDTALDFLFGTGIWGENWSGQEFSFLGLADLTGTIDDDNIIRFEQCADSSALDSNPIECPDEIYASFDGNQSLQRLFPSFSMRRTLEFQLEQDGRLSMTGSVGHIYAVFDGGSEQFSATAVAVPEPNAPCLFLLVVCLAVARCIPLGPTVLPA